MSPIGLCGVVELPDRRFAWAKGLPGPDDVHQLWDKGHCDRDVQRTQKVIEIRLRPFGDNTGPLGLHST